MLKKYFGLIKENTIFFGKELNSLEEFIEINGGETIFTEKKSISVEKINYDRFKISIPNPINSLDKDIYLSRAIAILLLQMGFAFEEDFRDIILNKWDDIQNKEIFEINLDIQDDNFENFAKMFLDEVKRP